MFDPRQIDRTEDTVSKRGRSIQGGSGLSLREEDDVRKESKKLANAMFGERALEEDETRALHLRLKRLASDRYGRKIKLRSIQLALKGGRFQGGKPKAYPIDAGREMKPKFDEVAACWGKSRRAAFEHLMRLADEAGLLPFRLDMG